AHTCGLRTNGHLICWGGDSNGEVSGPNVNSLTFSQVSAADERTCALGASNAPALADGHVVCWGGAGDLRYSFSQISSGEAGTTCGVKADAHFDCWNTYNSGLLGMVSVP